MQFQNGRNSAESESVERHPDECNGRTNKWFRNRDRPASPSHDPNERGFWNPLPSQNGLDLGEVTAAVFDVTGGGEQVR